MRVGPFRITIKVVAPGDARGWIGFGCFVLAVVVLVMIYRDRELLKDQAFLVLATAIIVTGWINGPVGWAYQATKGGGEAAESSARIAEQAASAAIAPSQTVQDVRVTNPETEPVPVEAKRDT